MKHPFIRILSLALAFCLLTACAALAELPTVDAAFPVGSVHSGFRVTHQAEIGYLDIDLIFMEHEKTGAQLIYAACDDPERTFGVAFRTQAPNDEGIPHVFEHTALSGSDKYPDSSLLFNMMQQTYNTYINAETRTYATLYPIASMSEDQLFADMDVYMDGVLHPLLLSDERAMKREAWHYSLEAPDGDLTLSGTVYSEMQANFGSASFVASYHLGKLLYPGSFTSNCAGGDPDRIPEMRYQELLDFHEKYYHPSNMLLMLYGQFDDVDRFLVRLDGEYLAGYERKETDTDDPDYHPAQGFKEETVYLPVSEGTDAANGAYIAYDLLLDGADRVDVNLAAVVAGSFTADNSPMKQTMSERFPTATFDMALNVSAPVPAMRFILFNANESDAPLFKKTVDELLPVIAGQGIDRSIVDAVVNRERFEKQTARESKNTGVSLFGSFADRWAYTGLADAALEDFDISDNLRAYSDEGAVDAVIGRYLLNPSASAMVTVVPQPGLAEKNAAAQTEALAALKASMSEAAIQALVSDCADYNAWLSESGKTSMIDRVRVVTAQSLPEEYPLAEAKDETRGDIRVISSEVADTDVFSCSLYLDAQTLPFDELLDATMATLLLSSTGTEAYSREALTGALLSKVNALSFGLQQVHFDSAPSHQYFVVSSNGLTDQLDDTFRLTEEILLRSDLTDHSIIREQAAYYSTMIDMYMNYSPNKLLSLIGQAAADADYFCDYYLNCSPELTAYLRAVARMDDTQLDALVERMTDAYRKLLHRPGAIFTVVGSADTVARCEALTDSLLSQLDGEALPQQDYAPYSDALKGNIALILDTAVAYNYQIISMEKMPRPLDGRMLVLDGIVSDQILIPELRFRKNAYGAYASTGRYFSTLYTYRDPNVAETYQTFSTVADTLRALTLTAEQTDGYITSAYGSIVTERGPIARASEAVTNCLQGFTEENRKLRYVREIKSFSPEDIAAGADMYETLMEQGVSVAGISEEMLAADPDRFDTVLRLKAAQPAAE